ncbi:DUF1292 domain-containing protein [Pseudalkalibacillus decolorationis]|uniref:DUF1292 domain-containing protein n=1 Tax=Pseudalkalibacillus decolorationis TaxID=163879 RepID=UPI002148C8A0|nr:DUF1292 domain-containing protein [Pseudalkalibacillus decolorationis]
MPEEEKERIIIPDENGEEHLFEVLFTFDVDETEHSYMVLIPVGDDGETEDDEEVEVFAFRYEDKSEKEDDIELFPIETDQEWDMIEEMINTFQASEEM